MTTEPEIRFRVHLDGLNADGILVGIRTVTVTAPNPVQAAGRAVVEAQRDRPFRTWITTQVRAR